MAALLVFIIATLEIIFGRKKLLESKGPLGDNVIKNPARYTYWDCVGVLWYKHEGILVPGSTGVPANMAAWWEPVIARRVSVATPT